MSKLSLAEALLKALPYSKSMSAPFQHEYEQFLLTLENLINI